MLLAIETATDRASVALGLPGADPLEENVAGARRHAAALLPMIQSLLRRAGASLDDVTGMVLSDGPGSFTGLRVGASVAKALVHRYRGARGPVFHLDCYRLRSPDEAADLDWEGLVAEGDAILIEWPERAGAWIPTPTRRFRLVHLPDPARRGLESL